MSREIKFRAEHGGTIYEVQTIVPMRRGSTGIFKQGGYVKRRVINHPFQDKRGYVTEHRLVVEEYLGRFLKDDEIIHHKNHIKHDNRIENLHVMTDQKRHAKAHAASLKRDEEAKTWLPDPLLGGKKFRLLNRNTGLMEFRNLSQLINTTFRRSQFEYKGEFTGLTDKNGVEIYEGDIVSDHNGIGEVEYAKKYAGFRVNYRNGQAKWFYDYNLKGERESIEIIGNIHQHPELLEE